MRLFDIAKLLWPKLQQLLFGIADAFSKNIIPLNEEFHAKLVYLLDGVIAAAFVAEALARGNREHAALLYGQARIIKLLLIKMRL